MNYVLNVLHGFMFTKMNYNVIMSRSKILMIKDNTDDPVSVLSQPKQELPVLVENVLTLVPIVEPESKLEPEEIISPKQMDTLFWCLFIIHYGYNEYQEVYRNYGVKELDIKKEIGAFIQKNPNKMKNTNVKITKAGVQEILSELLTSQKDTSMTCLPAILVFYNINILIVNADKNTILEFVADKDAEEKLPTYVLYKDSYNKYSLKTTAVIEKEILEMKENMFCLESYLKPLRPISNYKVDELECIAKKLGVFKKDRKYKKADLYQEIINIF